MLNCILTPIFSFWNYLCRFCVNISAKIGCVFRELTALFQGLKKKELDEEKEILVYVKHGETVYHGHTCPEIKDEIDIKVLELYTAKQLNYKPCSICFYLE